MVLLEKFTVKPFNIHLKPEATPFQIKSHRIPRISIPTVKKEVDILVEILDSQEM